MLFATGLKVVERIVRSVRAAVGEHCRNGPQQDLEIQTHGPVADVVQVESNHIGEGHLAAATDLPQSGQTWQCAQAPELPILVLLNLGRQRWPRPNQAPLA